MTCGSFSTLKDSDSVLGTYYGVLTVDNKKWFRCSEIDATNMEERCLIDGVKETCNVACEFDECKDSPLRFNFVDFNGDEYKSKCSLVNELSKTEKLKVCCYIGIDSHCPVTCENCSNH